MKAPDVSLLVPAIGPVDRIPIERKADQRRMTIVVVQQMLKDATTSGAGSCRGITARSCKSAVIKSGHSIYMPEILVLIRTESSRICKQEHP